MRTWGGRSAIFAVAGAEVESRRAAVGRQVDASEEAAVRFLRAR